ncbi:MAG: hypothetical protein ABSF83_13335 [Nitrososphaerales archaeon]|jgi:hypothetical protein
MPSKLAYYSTIALTAFVAFSVLAALVRLVPLGVMYSGAFLANVAGFIALALIAASGVMMLFRRTLLRRSRDPELLKAVHVWVAAAGGAFLIVHVVFFLLFPVTLPVLFGYAATYAAFVVWLSGLFFLEGVRGSLFYHGLLSLVGISLMVVHVFGAGGDIPLAFSGAALVLMASAVLGAAVWQFVKLSRDGTPRRPPGATPGRSGEAR